MQLQLMLLPLLICSHIPSSENMERRVFETILRGDVQAFLGLVREDEGVIKSTVQGSLNTILHLTARFGHVGLAAEILKSRPEMVAAENDRMETPLHEACREGRLEIVRLLLETDPWVVYKVNRDNESVLFVACERGRLDVVKQLLNYPWLLMLEMDGVTTSLHAAALAGHTEIVKELLVARQEFAWKKDLDGYTPLHLACSKGHFEIARELLKLDSDLACLQDNEGRTPLHWSAIKGRINISDEMLSLSLEPVEMVTRHGETILHLGVKNNQYELVKYLTERLDITRLVNMPDNDGNTILHLATSGKLSTMVTHLVKLGVNVNAINRKGYTALDVVEADASNSGLLLILPALQDAGAKRCDQLPPMSQELQPIPDKNSCIPSSWPKRAPESPYQHHRNRQRRRREKQIDLQTEGLRNARKTIIIVAVLIATVTFAAGINPPGGFNEVTGKSLVGRKTSFKVFMVCNIIALFLSLGIVIFLVSIIPFRRKTMMKLLRVTHKVMWLSTSFVAAAYIAAIWTIMPHGRGMVWVLAAVVAVGGGCTLAIFIGLGMLLARHWLRKWEWRKRKAKDESPHSSISRVEELQMAKRGSRESTSNSDLDSSSDKGGYHLY
ncbi:hypothetical protein ACOSP7_008330 [Xanthoceras sorbifolium]|uniref:PGG domain-containing protein n=1 Tax=Xanthoceras sorbifolium TaxID=99658 RepID=A0ABQ8IC78_9ROSI|nr:hypothetical protein JRO89_XS03G0272400 [Xanthoceras sorbifolium]